MNVASNAPALPVSTQLRIRALRRAIAKKIMHCGEQIDARDYTIRRIATDPNRAAPAGV